MHPRVQTFVEEAGERYGFEPDVKEFEDGTKTAADAAEAIGCELAQIAAGIAIETDDGVAVVVTSGANRVDMDVVAEELGVENADMADPDVVKETLGWSIGGVPPFCHENDVPVLVDEDLFEHEEVWAAGGTPDAVFPIDPTELVEYADGRRTRIQ